MNTASDITTGCKQSVNAYLLARTLFEVEREKVDEIHKRVLKDNRFFEDEDISEIRSRTEKGERITEPKNAWTMSTEDHKTYCSFVRDDLVKAGYEIKDIEGEEYYSYKCPALSAENVKRDAEHLIVDTFSASLDFGDDFAHKLLCNGLDTYHKFIDLCVGVVVNMPGYKNPLTGKEVTALNS